MMKKWSELSQLDDIDSEKAAEIFIKGGEGLGVDTVFLLISDVLAAYPPREAYNKLTDPPSLSGLIAVLGNIKSNLEDTDYMQCLGIIENSSSNIDVILKQNREIQSNTYLAAVLTLIDTMAGCSKMGLGNEDSIGVVSGSREFVHALFNDKHFVHLLKMMNQIYKKDKENGYKMMAPYMFAYAVLLDNETKSNVKLAFLPQNMEKFAEMQKAYFGDCLSETSVQTKNIYNDYFFNNACAANNREHFSEELPATSHALLEAVQATIQHEINTRVDSGERTHRSLAARWLNDSPWKIKQELPLSPVSITAVDDTLSRFK